MKRLIMGTKSLKSVDGHDRQIWVQPGIGLTEYEMGIFVECFHQEDDDDSFAGFFWGMVFPHNIFTCWRAMKLVELLPAIDENSLSYAYAAGIRAHSQSDYLRVKAITDQVGTKAREQIMGSYIPNDVVDVLLVLLDQENNIPTFSITSEVDAHTLVWNPAFTEFGIEHPALLRAREEALKPYQKYLALYATYHGLMETSSLMGGIQTYLLAAIERKIDTYGIDIAFATAVVKERLDQLERESTFIDDFDATTPEEVIAATANWASANFTRGWFIKSPIRMPDTYVDMLHKLISLWDYLEVQPLFVP